MQVTQLGDRVHVHYVKRFEDGTVVSSRGRGDAPLEVTVGARHPRLPGLWDQLAGLTPGSRVTVAVPADRAYGPRDPARVRRVARARFNPEIALVAGKRARMRIRDGKARVVRVVETGGQVVVVDINHPRCGQSVVVEVEMLSILARVHEPGH